MRSYEKESYVINLWMDRIDGASWSLVYYDEDERDADWERLRSCLLKGWLFDYDGVVLIQNHYEVPLSVTINPARIMMMRKGIRTSLDITKFELKGDDWEARWVLKEEYRREQDE